MITTVSYQDLRDVLMDPHSKGAKEPYFIIHSPESQENITILVSSLYGNEFNKTIGFFHQFPGVLTYRCLYGHGVLLIQKNNENGEAQEIIVAGLKPGTEVEVPSGYGHTVVNTGKNFLVMVDNAPKEEKYRNKEIIKNKRGLAYYIIDKKGEITFENNTNYNFHPQINNY